MKIVIVGQYYWPDVFSINDIAEDLVKKGHRVTVITGLPDYADCVIPKEYRFGKNRHEIRNGVSIYRVPIIARHHGLFFRVLNYISFCLSSSIFVRLHKIEADVIMAYQTAPVFMGNAAIVLKKKINKPLFFYCMDIWPDQMKIWNVNEKNPVFSVVKKYCQYAYGSGNLVGISSFPFKRYMIKVNKVDKNKIVYLPQFSSNNTVEKTEAEQTIKDDRTDFIFAGNIGLQQNIECLLKAVSLINCSKQYHIHIYGGGTGLEKYKRLSHELGLDKSVTFYGRVPKEKLTDIYSTMDAFILTLASSKKIGYAANTVPAKLQEYMRMGKPIFASVDGGAKDIIEKCRCGKAVKADDADAYAKALTDFIEHPEKYSECGKRAQRYFEKHFTREKVINQLEGILRRLVNDEYTLTMNDNGR